MPTPVLHQKSPFQMLYHKPPVFLDLKVFGSLCFVSTLEQHRTKLDPRARKCIFLGYKYGTKGYLTFDLHSREIVLSRNVIFHESIFPYATSSGAITSTTPHNAQNSSQNFDFLFDIPSNTSPPTSQPSSTTVSIAPESDLVHNTTLTSDSSPKIRKSERTRKAPAFLKDFHCSASSSSSSNAGNIKYPLSSVLSYDSLSSKHLKYTLALSTSIEPKSYKQAILSSEWINAMNVELQALAANNTWHLTKLPLGKVAIGCRWVYRIKRKADGTVERYKARLVAQGYTQQEGVDFFDTFSPVAKLTTMRLLLAIAAAQGWFLKQLDVDNAFLHGDLNEEVYMKLPPGLQPEFPNQVCRLQKSLYGLRQASRQWFSKLSNSLVSLGFRHSEYDHSLFTKSQNGSFTALLVYVDDIILTGNSLSSIESVKNFLHATFKIKDLGDLKYFLGLEVSRSHKGIHLCQRKYALYILSETGLLAAKQCYTPIVRDSKLLYDSSAPPHDPTAYRRIIGKLLYLTNTRPGISFAVQKLSQFMQHPTIHHYEAAMRILRYIKSAPPQGLFFPSESSLQLKAFSDSDWASCLTT
jgi:hypothetical protein